MNTPSLISLLTDNVKRLLKGETNINYENLVLERVEGAQSVCDILNSFNEDYILAFQSKHNDNEDLEAAESSRTSDDLSTVIGSPLKLRNFQDELRFETVTASTKNTRHKLNLARLKPVSVNVARLLVSNFNIAAGIQRDQWPSLWVLCDGCDAECTVFISTKVEVTSKENTSCQISPITNEPSSSDSNKRFTIKSYCINVTGPLTDQSKLPSVDSLIRNTSLKQLYNASYMAKYELIGKASTVSDTNDNIAICQSSVEATVHWDHKSMLLDEPPVDASASLSVTAVSGDPRSSARDLYNDLCTLQGLCCGLSDGIVKWSVVDSDSSLIDRVKQLIADQQLGDGAVGSQNKANRASADDDSETLKYLQLAERQDLDFTELLWNILRDCSSYSELVGCLEHVVSCLVQGNLQPMVHKQNKTRLADIVRESYYGQLNPTILTKCSPLELVVEIGFDKLFRDYINIFIVKDLVTMSHLKWFVVDDNNATFTSRLTRIEKLHRVLEMVTMLERFLMLTRPHLSTLTRQALAFYETHTLNESDVFTIPLPAVTIMSLIKSCRPYLWKVDYESSLPNNKLHATVAFTLSAPFPHLVTSEEFQESAAHESKKYTGYFVTAINEFSYDV